MFQALTRFLRGGRHESQLELGFHAPVPHDAEALLVRLQQLGLQRIARCRLTRNRNVMVSFARGELRVHEGYLAAPEPVLAAIVAFVEGRTRAARRDAQRTIVAFPIRSSQAPSRRERTHPDDAAIADQLREWHARYNAEHFAGTLGTVDIRVSRRMRSRLGHYTAAAQAGDAAEIAISLTHLRRHGWDETLHTLLHEMVHQWQDETSHTVDHGRTFRTRARAVGIAPSARRALPGRTGRQHGAISLARMAARTD